MPYFRQSSEIGTPASACVRQYASCSPVNFDSRIGRSLQLTESEPLPWTVSWGEANEKVKRMTVIGDATGGRCALETDSSRVTHWTSGIPVIGLE